MTVSKIARNNSSTPLLVVTVPSELYNHSELIRTWTIEAGGTFVRPAGLWSGGWAYFENESQVTAFIMRWS